MQDTRETTSVLKMSDTAMASGIINGFFFIYINPESYLAEEYVNIAIVKTQTSRCSSD